ncbi:choice-of-anchor R domain-containing protein [Brevibacillus dissolubilis]|uniref:choice-of-anchor R domain-containing protein n=1 Tax=Brevibacillus dissolubilis TaxID=1844116 RepID=UPI00111612C1|nr:choice-of-anchor R domain-containing protein [Brevibacillus dissolubilis]
MPIQNEARASYVGVGRKQIIEQTFWQIPWWRLTDPLAQTFMLTEERFITSIDLYFATKDPTADITIQIRQVSNGYPSMNVLTSKVLNASQVRVSNDGSLSTRVTFPDPVLLQANTEYAVVLLTSSSQYRAYVARMSNKDILTQRVVARQPYDVGLLFSSSNGSAWTAHQDMDLKFKLYGAKFKSQSVLMTQKTTLKDATHLVLAVNQLVPQRSEIQWQYSTDKNTWFALADQDVTQLGSPATEVYVRALLNSKGSSPVIQTSMNAIAMSYKPAGVYMSRAITSAAPFTKVTVYVDLFTPSGTNQSLVYSVDNGQTWISMGSATEQTPIDAQFTQLKFEKNLSTAATSLRIRIRQNTTVPTITPKARNLMVHIS